MARSTVFGKAHKCPNCHAHLAAAGDRVRCEYCGVMITLRDPPPAPPPPRPAPVAPAPAPRAERHRGPRMGPAFLMGPLMVGGILYYTYVMQRQATERTDRARQASEEARTGRATAAPGRTSPESKPPTRGDEPARTDVDPVCRLSQKAARAIVRAHQARVAACFAGAAPAGGLEGDLEVVIGGRGEVTAAALKLVTAGDDKPWDAPAAAAGCAEEAGRAWKFPAPARGRPTRCAFHLELGSR